MTNTHQTIAETILQQLGGNRFLAMTGANYLMYDGPALRFRLPRGARGVKHVKIALTQHDLYDVTFQATTGRVIAERAGVPCDSLRSVFTAVTGFDTTL